MVSFLCTMFCMCIYTDVKQTSRRENISLTCAVPQEGRESVARGRGVVSARETK